jgi:hypothetical protein
MVFTNRWSSTASLEATAHGDRAGGYDQASAPMRTRAWPVLRCAAHVPRTGVERRHHPSFRSLGKIKADKPNLL